MKQSYIQQQARDRAAIKAGIAAALITVSAFALAATQSGTRVQAVATIEPTRIEAPQPAETLDTMQRIEYVEPTPIEQVIAVEAVKAAAPEIVPEPAPLTYWGEIPLDAEVQHHLVAMCRERGIDPAIIFAQIWRESNFRAHVIGDRGNSFGLMQIQPRWHSARMDKLGVTDLLDPVQNVTVGIDYLDELIDRYDGDVAKALTAYNRGHYNGTVTQYALDVLAEAERMAANVLH